MFLQFFWFWCMFEAQMNLYIYLSGRYLKLFDWNEQWSSQVKTIFRIFPKCPTMISLINVLFQPQMNNTNVVSRVISFVWCMRFRYNIVVIWLHMSELTHHLHKFVHIYIFTMFHFFFSVGLYIWHTCPEQYKWNESMYM